MRITAVVENYLGQALLICPKCKGAGKWFEAVKVVVKKSGQESVKRKRLKTQSRFQALRLDGWECSRVDCSFCGRSGMVVEGK